MDSIFNEIQNSEYQTPHPDPHKCHGLDSHIKSFFGTYANRADPDQPPDQGLHCLLTKFSICK